MGNEKLEEQVRILSGINSINFFQGYNPNTRIFDKRKTNMEERGRIYCFTDGNGKRPDLENETKVTQTLLEYANYPSFLRRGRKYIMSGIVSRNELAPGNFSYVIGPTLKVDKLFECKGGIWRPKRIVNISDQF